MLDHVPRNLLPELFNELWTLRTRTDQAHIPSQNIEKLWQLIDTRLADKPSDRCDTRIVFDRPALLFLGLRLYLHRPELVHAERNIVQSHPLLRKDQRSRRRQFDQRCCDQHHR